MRVRDIMSSEPACCTPDTTLQRVAQMMLEHDCGAIPVITDTRERRPLGIVTDRDITCRVVARGQNPLEMTVEQCMTDGVCTISPDARIKDCCHMMEEAQIRRLLVVDDDGKVCGIVSQADLALHAPKKEVAEVLYEVSQQGEAHD